MEHFDVENRLDRISDLHDEIIEYMESIFEYDDLDKDEYIEAYLEAERLIESGELD